MRGHRPRHWLALALAAILSTGVLATGLVVGSASPARAASLGTVALSQPSGKVSDNPMFATADTSAPCPSGWGENAGLRVGRPGGPYSNLAPALGGGGLDAAPVHFSANRSFTTALGGTAPGDGAWLVIVECFSLLQGRHVDEFQTPIFVCGDTWRVGDSCGTATQTETRLDVSPTGRIPEGTSVTLTATVSPNTAAGEVTFTRNDPRASTPVTLGAATVSGGTATLQTSDLPIVGTDASGEQSYSVVAAFAPADPDAFLASTSPAKSIVVFRGSTKGTTTELTVTPASPTGSGAAVTLSAVVTVNGDPGTKPAGKVKFERRASGASGSWTAITEVDLAEGAATHTLAAGALPDGAYDFQATYLPGTGTDFGQSSKSVSNYVVGKPAEAVTTTTALAVTPTGSAAEGAEVTLTATVSPSAAAGTVQFRDGATLLDTASLTSGTSTFKTSALAVGDHSFTAAFVPTNATVYKASTSSTLTYEITSPDDDGDDDGDGDGDGGGGGSLASTGTPLVAIGTSGLLLIGLGAGAMLVTRRRREPEPVHWPDSQE